MADEVGYQLMPGEVLFPAQVRRASWNLSSDPDLISEGPCRVLNAARPMPSDPVRKVKRA